MVDTAGWLASDFARSDPCFTLMVQGSGSCLHAYARAPAVRFFGFVEICLQLGT